MKWIVGLDLRPHSQGAIKFGAWLAKTTGDQLVGIHVLEESHLQQILRHHHLDEVLKISREAATQAVAGAGASDMLGEAYVVHGLHTDESLAAAKVYHHGGGLLIGRHAKQEDHAIVRLGRVARRMLRRLPGPVIVVPPDLEPANIGSGPVVALTNLTSDSEAACKFAKHLADRIGRKLVVAHAVPLPEDYGAQYLPADSLGKLRIQHQEEGRRDLVAWTHGLGLADAQLYVIQGQLVHHTEQLVRNLGAALLVCGSRRLSLLDRVLLTSTGSELASVLPCPVAVVPPN